MKMDGTSCGIAGSINTSKNRYKKPDSTPGLILGWTSYLGQVGEKDETIL